MSRQAHTSLVRRFVPALVAVAAIMSLAAPAQAHHAMDGQLPSSLFGGLLSGLGHPVIGLDHLAFVIGVGLAAANLPHRALMPLAFVVATVLGVVVHLTAADLPLVEVIISLSVLIVGVLLVSGRALASAAWVALFAIAGLFHGYAYGESIVGAEPTPLAAYFVGFAAIQYAIAMGAMSVLRGVSAGGATREPLRVAGGVVAGIGLVFMHQAVWPF